MNKKWIWLWVIIAVLLVTVFVLFRYGVSAGTHLPAGHMCLWVKVVDDSGTPISGYKTTIIEVSPPLFPFMKEPRRDRKVLVTDAKGIIKEEPNGEVWGVQIGDWRNEMENNDGYFSISRTGIMIGSADHKGSENDPCIYRVDRTDGYANLSYLRNKRGAISKKSNYLCLNVRTGEVTESDMPCGDIAIRHVDDKIMRQPWPTVGDKSDERSSYEEVLAFTGEGVMPVDQDFFVKGPGSGYKKKLIWPDDWQPQFTYGGNVRFFFRVSVPPIYGYAEISANATHEAYYFSFYANPSGQRGLFYKGYPLEEIPEGIELK
jgi:hypothetical protein